MVRIFIPPTEGHPNQVTPDYTHIAVILDRTGSMESIRDDTIGGFNSFLNEQKQQLGKANCLKITAPYANITAYDPT